MKKVLCYVIGMLIVITTVQFILNSYFIRNPGVLKSRSISESKENKAFIAQYKIRSVDSSVTDSLKKYQYQERFYKADIWAENYSSRQPKFIFFYPRIYSKEVFLNYSDPVLGDCESEDIFGLRIIQGELPEVALIPKGIDYQKYAPYRPVHSYKLWEEHLPDEMKLEAYFFWRNREPQYSPLGALTIRKSETSEGRNKENLWESFHLLPVVKMIKDSDECRCCQK